MNTSCRLKGTTKLFVCIKLAYRIVIKYLQHRGFLVSKAEI